MSLMKDSQYLSYLLRHHPEDANLNMDDFGYVNVDELIKNTKGRFNINKLNEIVKTDEKMRYSYNEDKTQIRANQGHSIPGINPGLKEAIPPDELYHGTALRFLDSIKKEGIKKQTRAYVHLSGNKKTAKIVGSRHGDPIVLTIDTKAMIQDGIKFYISENKVWLTNYIDFKYVKEY